MRLNMFEFLSDWKNWAERDGRSVVNSALTWAQEKGQAVLTKAKPTLMKLRRRIEVLPGNAITLATLSTTTLLAWINNNPINNIHYRTRGQEPVLGRHGWGEYGQERVDYALGFNINLKREGTFFYQALLFGAAAFTMLQMFRAKRMAQVKKVETASNAGESIKNIKEAHDTDFLPMPVSDLLSLHRDSVSTDSKSLSEQEKFVVLENYIKAGYSPELLCRIVQEEGLSKVRDEDRNTLLHVAARTGDSDLVKRLIGVGFECDPFMENKMGIKPRSLAYQSEPLVAKILLDFERRCQCSNARDLVPYGVTSSAATWSTVTATAKPDSKNDKGTTITAA